MKLKVSVNLPKELVRELDKLVEQYGSRSAIAEEAIRAFLYASHKPIRDAKDLKILNQRADALNAESKDVLQYQANL